MVKWLTFECLETALFVTCGEAAQVNVSEFSIWRIESPAAVTGQRKGDWSGPYFVDFDLKNQMHDNPRSDELCRDT